MTWTENFICIMVRSSSLQMDEENFNVVEASMREGEANYVDEEQRPPPHPAAPARQTRARKRTRRWSPDLRLPANKDVASRWYRIYPDRADCHNGYCVDTDPGHSNRNCPRQHHWRARLERETDQERAHPMAFRKSLPPTHEQQHSRALVSSQAVMPPHRSSPSIVLTGNHQVIINMLGGDSKDLLGALAAGMAGPKHLRDRLVGVVDSETCLCCSVS